MKYVKSTVAKPPEEKEPPKEESQEHEPIQMTMHNTTKMWRGFFLIILIAAILALCSKYLFKLIIGIIIAFYYVFTNT